MTFEAGTRFGPYEVLSPLGAGGMGEVYRARDMRLGREVAIKVLPAVLSSDGERVKRFEKEARAASALNHPNVVTIYDVGQSDSRFYIAMELVSGKTLRELLAAGALPVRKQLSIASQAAEGLAKAHAAGIVHRDLKPENLMVTEDGHVKLLDFGLAKLMDLDTPEEQKTHAPTASVGTEPGIVMGTVGYMSPEQAAALPLDFRSDQFSFGSVLYEMATGKQPFRRASIPQTLAAIIQEEPEPIGSLSPTTPAPLRWLVERCLAKEAKERYASTEDLARELRSLRDHVSELGRSEEDLSVAPSRRTLRVARPVLGAALLAAAAAGIFVGNRALRPAASTLLFERLTFRRGTVEEARFSSDGQTIVYSAAWDGNPAELYSTREGALESRPLGIARANMRAVSSSGEMAFVLDAAPGSIAGTLARAPLAGGAPREVLENVQWADWSPDGKNLAVVRDVEDRSRLEYPIGKVLYQIPSSGALWMPRFSPTGDRIAFIEFPDRTASSGSVEVVDLSGKKTTFTKKSYSNLFGLAWEPDGKRVWFSGAGEKEVQSSLYNADPRRGEREVYSAPLSLRLMDIGGNGRFLVAAMHFRAGINALAPGDHVERDLSWLDGSCASDLSADGQTLLISETRTLGETIYIRKTAAGSPAKRLGDGFAYALSADGNWAATLAPDGRIVLLPTGAGEARTVVYHALVDVFNLRFSPDGSDLFLIAAEKEHGPRLYVGDREGKTLRPLSPEGIDSYGLSVSPDGRTATAIGANRIPSVYPVSGGEPRALPGAMPGDIPIRFSANGRLLYLLRLGERSAQIDRLDLTSGRRESWKSLASSDPAGVTPSRCVQVTPDGQYYAYTYRRLLNELFLVSSPR